MSIQNYLGIKFNDLPPVTTFVVCYTWNWCDFDADLKYEPI